MADTSARRPLLRRIFFRNSIPFLLLIFMTLILMAGLMPGLYSPVNARVVSYLGAGRARQLYLFSYISMLVFLGYSVLLPIWSGIWFRPDSGKSRAMGCIATVWSMALVALFLLGSVSALPHLWDIQVENLAPYLGKSLAVRFTAGFAMMTVVLGVYAPDAAYGVLKRFLGLPDTHRETVVDIIHNLSYIALVVILVSLSAGFAQWFRFF